MVEVPGSEFEIKADLVLLAMGFVGPVQRGPARAARRRARRAQQRARPTPTSYRTSVPKVFAAGDMRRGQSLVVWAIREGRQCARAVDEFLMGASELAALASRVPMTADRHARPARAGARRSPACRPGRSSARALEGGGVLDAAARRASS